MAFSYKKWQEKAIKKQAFQDLVYRLKRDGLITIEEDKKGFFPRITAKGNKRLQSLQNQLYRPATHYFLEKDSIIKIIVFDIPERERWKRDWLRNVLRRLKFQILQRSVWVGNAKIPRELLDDLKELNLISCVEILAITKTGSLRQMS